MTPRSTKALELMKGGAYWRKALEKTYMGEKFCMRLKSAAGGTIPGFGFKTFYELESAGALASKECLSSSTWPTEWKLAA